MSLVRASVGVGKAAIYAGCCLGCFFCCGHAGFPPLSRPRHLLIPAFGAETVVTLQPFTPVGVTFAPDGRMFIWQKNGIVRIYKNGALLGEPFIDISSKVNNFHDRGLLGFVLDPDFATNGYACLFYTCEDGSTPSNGAKTAQLIRVTADPANPDVALPSSEVVLLGAITSPPCSSHPAGSDCIPADAISHTVGMIRFLSDGTLLLSNGDGVDFNVEDPLALRAQDLDSYAGKILRIRPDDTAPSDNPFYDGTNSIRSKVYAYGLRNPYRFFCRSGHWSGLLRRCRLEHLGGSQLGSRGELRLALL